MGRRSMRVGPVEELHAEMFARMTPEDRVASESAYEAELSKLLGGCQPRLSRTLWNLRWRSPA